MHLGDVVAGAPFVLFVHYFVLILWISYMMISDRVLMRMIKHHQPIRDAHYLPHGAESLSCTKEAPH